MVWQLQISSRFLLLGLLIFVLMLYLSYTFNYCVISNINNALKKNVQSAARNTQISDYTKVEKNSSKLARRLPDVLVIGVKKCGTRALLEFIRIHPDVRAAGSEVHFFDKYYHKGLEWYRQHMPLTTKKQVTMEKTPSYWVTHSAPRRVYAMNPNIKLLVVVRDPVTRAISDYTQAASKKLSTPPFEHLAFVNGSAHFSTWMSSFTDSTVLPSVVDTTWPPVRLGVYARPLRRWLRRFPRKKLLIVNGETLVTNPAAEMARVQDFLGLKRIITNKYFYFNSTKGFPCLLKLGSRSVPHCLGKTKGRNHPHIEPAAIQRLREFYRPFNERFYQLAGVNFNWP